LLMYGKSSNRGYLYTLEILIVFSILFVVMIYLFKSPEVKPELDISLIKQQGFDALTYLDMENNLRKMIIQGDEKEIEDALKNLIPKNVGFETQICRHYCDDSNVPKNQTVIVLDYYISGYGNEYNNKKLRLWLWRKL